MVPPDASLAPADSADSCWIGRIPFVSMSGAAILPFTEQAPHLLHVCAKRGRPLGCDAVAPLDPGGRQRAAAGEPPRLFEPRRVRREVAVREVQRLAGGPRG